MDQPFHDGLCGGDSPESVFFLETALLRLSGLETADALSAWQSKIHAIFLRFLEKSEPGIPPHSFKPPPYLHFDVARRLFEYLWISKPRRFGTPFLLTEVVEAQLDPDGGRPVGTCVGLTSLYSVLGLRAGLRLSLLLNADHVMTRLRVGDRFFDLDHTDPLGFDCRSGEGFRELPLGTLSAVVLNCRGLRHESRGRIDEAMEDYQRAIAIHPEYANALNNRANMRVLRGDLQGALGDYGEALRLNPVFCDAYCNRGMARHRLGDREGAREDYQRALALDPNHGDARRCLGLLDSSRGFHSSYDHPTSRIEAGSPSRYLGKRSQFPF